MISDHDFVLTHYRDVQMEGPSVPNAVKDHRSGRPLAVDCAGSRPRFADARSAARHAGSDGQICLPHYIQMLFHGHFQRDTGGFYSGWTAESICMVSFAEI
jgi:hypothetical protein